MARGIGMSMSASASTTSEPVIYAVFRIISAAKGDLEVAFPTWQRLLHLFCSDVGITITIHDSEVPYSQESDYFTCLDYGCG